MSPELETLDQLAGGDMPLSLIHGLYPDDAGFICGLSGLLKGGGSAIGGGGWGGATRVALA